MSAFVHFLQPLPSLLAVLSYAPLTLFTKIASLCLPFSMFGGEKLPNIHGEHVSDGLHENFFHLAHKDKMMDGEWSSFFIAQAGGVSLFNQIMLVALIFMVFYILILRPQAKRQQMTEFKKRAIMKGDMIITSGGVMGKAVGFREEGRVVVVEISKEVKMNVIRAMVHDVLVDLDKRGNRVDGKTPPVVVPASEAKNAKDAKK